MYQMPYEFPDLHQKSDIQNSIWLAGSILLLMIPFLVVNGILTGTGPDAPVVMYDDAENLGLRIGTIPIEDVVYGFELFLLNLFLFRYFETRIKPTGT